MKTLKSILSLLLVTLCISSTFTSCEKTNVSGDTTLSSTDISSYKIVRVDAASGKLPTMTSNFKKAILEYTKAELEVTTDYVKRGEELDESGSEILIGDTNRTVSINALAELDEKGYEGGFIIKAEGNKIAIVGTDDSQTILAIKYFINNYVMKSEKANTLPIKSGDTVIEETGKILHMTADFNAIVLEKLTTVFEPGTIKSQIWETYAKVIKLEHSGEHNGTLLATHEQRPNNSSDHLFRYPIFRSTDDGDTWEQIALVNDTYNKNPTVGYQPYLFELPEDIGSFKKGTILLGGCTRTNNQSQTIMVLYYSTDVGKNWKTWGNIDVGGAYHSDQYTSNGLWEPVFMYEESTKRLYCFYSDEMDPGHSQRLVYKYTTDMKTWSKKYEAVACENKMLRPGMVALTKMGDKYALAFELGGIREEGGYPIYVKIADSLDDWGDISDYGQLVAAPGDKIMGSGPAIAWTPLGGECGTLMVTAHGMLSGYTKTKCDLFLSFDYGKTFIAIDNPIPNMPNEHTGSGYSPGFYVDSDGSVYYVNDPEVAPNSLCEKLMFAKIKIY